MADSFTYTVHDSILKPTAMTINIPELTSANYDPVGVLIAALKAALDTVQVSGLTRTTTSVIATDGGPGDAAGVRGNKMVIKWFSPLEADGEGQYGSNELGCADVNEFTVVGGRRILQGANYTAIKAAFDALAVTENGHPVEVYEIEFLSRGL